MELGFISILVIVTILGLAIGFSRIVAAIKKAKSLGKGKDECRPISRPVYHAIYSAMTLTIGAICVMALFAILKAVAPEIYSNINGDSSLYLFTAGIVAIQSTLLWKNISISFPARQRVEKIAVRILFLCTAISVFITIAIVLSVLFEAIRFFDMMGLKNFLFGTHWSPQTAMRADQAGSTGSFGAIPLFVGTLLIMLVAMTIAAPLGLFSAIFMAEYASPKVRNICKPMLEILAGIPTVVYGYFAVVAVAPYLREIGESYGIAVASESALGAGIVMGIMIVPFISSLSDDVISAVPQSLRDASYGLGSTKNETIRKVVLPAALPGIVGALLLAVSRAIGETMIVVMAAGLAANLTFNPLDAVTTVTAQMVSLLVGDQEFDSAKTLAAFALGLSLFVITLILNVIALVVVKKYREQYD